MKKNLTSMLSIILLFGIIGCSNNEQKKSQTGEEVLEIILPTFKAGENVGAKLFSQQITRFNEKYVGKYKITREEVPEAMYIEKIKQLARQGKLPVLMHGQGNMDQEWFNTVAIPNGYVYDLSEWYQASPAKDLFIQASVEYSTIDGALVTVPAIIIRPMGLFYNTELYNPKKAISQMSVDEFIQSLGTNKISLQTGENAWVTMILLSTLIANEEGGAELLRSHTEDKLTDYNQKPIIQAVAKLQKIFMENATLNSIGAIYADAANSFMSKNAAVIFNGPWMSSEFSVESADKWSNNFDGASISADLLPGNVGLATTNAFGDWWVSATSSDKEIELAKVFLDFLCTQEELEASLLAEGGSSSNLDYSEGFLQKQNENKLLNQLALAINEKTQIVPIFIDIMPMSVSEYEVAKFLPQLADGTISPKEFCDVLSRKSKEAISN